MKLSVLLCVFLIVSNCRLCVLKEFMYWDNNIANAAQNIANTCVYGHVAVHDRGQSVRIFTQNSIHTTRKVLTGPVRLRPGGASMFLTSIQPDFQKKLNTIHSWFGITPCMSDAVTLIFL
ncbi:uncharacterized protein LOC132701312 [Cylas formicarius]|uniref:uncharacterized protein LOC132701312 n=1 Tax=Cylas formicarius TaxID=197179 RepID=UPI0029589F4B|nr:uncharacterized protein LOC132701312 [Cylas formicarius]XP_060525101.1 uncharacterized protein LOC132701312 [Cylas formicarius]